MVLRKSDKILTKCHLSDFCQTKSDICLTNCCLSDKCQTNSDKNLTNDILSEFCQTVDLIQNCKSVSIIYIILNHFMHSFLQLLIQTCAILPFHTNLITTMGKSAMKVKVAKATIKRPAAGFNKLVKDMSGKEMSTAEKIKMLHDKSNTGKDCELDTKIELFKNGKIDETKFTTTETHKLWSRLNYHREKD